LQHAADKVHELHPAFWTDVGKRMCQAKTVQQRPTAMSQWLDFYGAWDLEQVVLTTHLPMLAD